MDWKEFVLDNRLKVIYKSLPESHSVSVGVWSNVGSRYERKAVSGISHFIEHLLFKGTSTRSYRELKEAIEGVGGSFNAFTSVEMTCYYIKILSRYLRLSIDILSDMTQHPLLKEEEIEKERNVILQEINMYKDLPAHYVHEVFDEMLFAKHPLGRSIAGVDETVKSMSRNMISDFLSSHYSPDNLVLSVTGKFSESQLMDFTEQFWGNMLVGKKNTCLLWCKKNKGLNGKNIYKKTEQSHFCVGGLTFSRFDPDRFALHVLNVILGGNMSSRLFNEIREKRGLAYSIKSYTKSYRDTGAFVIYAGVEHSKTEESLKVIMGELDKIRKKSVKKKEISYAKKFLVSQFLMSLEDNLEYMMWIGEQRLLRKDLLAIQNIVDFINKVTTEDVLRVAQRIFDRNNMSFAGIGPGKNDKQKFIDCIGKF